MFVSLLSIWKDVLLPPKFDGTFSVIFEFKFKAPFELGIKFEFSPVDDEFN